MPRLWLEELDGSVIDAGDLGWLSPCVKYRGHRYTLVAHLIHGQWPLGIYKRDPE